MTGNEGRTGTTRRLRDAGGRARTLSRATGTGPTDRGARSDERSGPIPHRYEARDETPRSPERNDEPKDREPPAQNDEAMAHQGADLEARIGPRHERPVGPPVHPLVHVPKLMDRFRDAQEDCNQKDEPEGNHGERISDDLGQFSFVQIAQIVPATWTRRTGHPHVAQFGTLPDAWLFEWPPRAPSVGNSLPHVRHG